MIYSVWIDITLSIFEGNSNSDIEMIKLVIMHILLNMMNGCMMYDVWCISKNFELPSIASNLIILIYDHNDVSWSDIVINNIHK